MKETKEENINQENASEVDGNLDPDEQHLNNDSSDQENVSEKAEDATQGTEDISEQVKQIEALKQENEEWKSRALRAQADLENIRRRHREEQEKAAKYRAQNLVEALLPVLDNFERAINFKPESEEASSLLEGVNMVYSQLYSALQQEGVDVIAAQGETFDPHLHQAVMQVEEEGFDSGMVVEEMQTGYKLKDKVIRPAMVKVNA